jgi:hypothetical protein
MTTKKIEQEMLAAIANKTYWRKSNTEVYHDYYTGDIRIRLFGHIIAVITSETVHLTDAGYQTATTKSRLNALLEYFKEGDTIQVISSVRGTWRIYSTAGSSYSRIWTGELIFDNPHNPANSTPPPVPVITPKDMSFVL